MPITKKVPPLPRPDTPLAGPGGTMNPDWYRFFAALIALLQEMAQEIP